MDIIRQLIRDYTRWQTVATRELYRSIQLRVHEDSIPASDQMIKDAILRHYLSDIGENIDHPNVRLELSIHRDHTDVYMNPLVNHVMRIGNFRIDLDLTEESVHDYMRHLPETNQSVRCLLIGTIYSVGVTTIIDNFIGSISAFCHCVDMAISMIPAEPNEYAYKLALYMARAVSASSRYPHNDGVNLLAIDGMGMIRYTYLVERAEDVHEYSRLRAHLPDYRLSALDIVEAYFKYHHQRLFPGRSVPFESVFTEYNKKREARHSEQLDERRWFNEYINGNAP